MQKKGRPTIGLMINQLEGKSHTPIWNGFADIAEEKDVNLIIYTGKTFNQPWSYEFQENVVYHMIQPAILDGLLITTSNIYNLIGEDLFRNFIDRYQSIPRVSLSAAYKGIPSILVDNKSGMRAIVDHMIEVHGYKKIAFICGPESNIEANLRLDAYKESLLSHGIPIDPQLILPGNFIPDDGAKAVKTLLEERKQTCRAIVAANDEMAIRAIIALKERGLRVPQDVAVAGFDDIDSALFMNPPLSTVTQPLYEMSRKAMCLILSMMEGEEAPEITTFPALMKVRESCGCLALPEEKALSYTPSISLKSPFHENYTNNKKNIVQAFITTLGVPEEKRSSYHIILNSVLNALISDIEDQLTSGGCIQVLNEILSQSVFTARENFFWNDALAELREILISLKPNPAELKALEKIFQNSLILWGDINKRKEGYERNQSILVGIKLRSFLNAIININDSKDMLDAVASNMLDLGFRNCYVSVFDEKAKKLDATEWKIPRSARNILSVVNNKKESKNGKGIIFPTIDLVPLKFHPGDVRYTWIVRALFDRVEHYGFIVYELATRIEDVFETTHKIISSGLRTTNLWEKRQQAQHKLKETMKELKDSNLKLSKLDDMKNDFIANITHDFRSPLTIILNNAELGLKDQNTELKEFHRRLNVIYEASFKLKDTIDRLLDLAKMDAQGVRLNIKKVRIRSFLENLTDFYKSAVMSSHIKILDILPVYEIDNFYTDLEKLEEILINILSNALKYVDPETGEIQIELEDKNTEILIIISDNGIGIPRDKLESIFGRFEQVEGGRNSAYKGTGIGLAFSKQLAEYLKGKIHAESDGPGKGSRFIINLKKGKDLFNAEDIDESQEAANQTHSSRLSLIREIESKIPGKFEQNDEIETILKNLNPDYSFIVKKALFLIVDDNASIREIVKEFLIQAGYQNFILAKNGKQGIEAAFQYRPDIIVCDYNMPVMRGDEFHNELVNNPDFKRIPFIFLTAIADKSIIAERKRKGAIAYLGKPIDGEDLLLTIDIHLSKYMEFKETLIRATMDELTRLNNRRNFYKLLKERLATRNFRHLSLIFFDIDFFKRFNDIYGHQVGDIVLTTVGRIVKDTIRQYDVAGRYGGEEFIIMLPDTDIKQAQIVAEKLRFNIEAHQLTIKELSLSVTSSFGIASLIDNEADMAEIVGIPSLTAIYEIKDSKSADWEKIDATKAFITEELIKFADLALYQAKYTTCLSCGFQSEKIDLFNHDTCSKCGSKNLERGRNRVKLFESKFLNSEQLNT